eukprot:2552192-Pleurochrysis_carterae.AAC.3
MADAPTEQSPSHELRLQEQAQDLLAGIEAVVHTLPAVAIDREAPFSGEGKGLGIPLALSSEVGTQGGSRVRARLFAKSLLTVRFGEAEKRGLRRTRMHLGV